jgi:hypothetical protein
LRLLLDAHESGRRLGKALRDLGHDVLAVSEEPALDGWSDEALLRLAADDGRITVTHNVRHFIPLLIEWGESGRAHAGCVLVKGIDHAQYGLLLTGLEQLLEARSRQEEWVDLAMWLTPASVRRS